LRCKKKTATLQSCCYSRSENCGRSSSISLSNAQKSTDDLIAAFSNPANPLTDIELAVLKVNAEQAEKDGNKELASLF
jgi:hypothetical protein